MDAIPTFPGAADDVLPDDFLPDDEVTRRLDLRLGRIHARQRNGIESEHEAQVFGQGRTLFHLENMPGAGAVIGALLRVTGTYGLGRANAANVQLRVNEVASARVPPPFDGFRILHLSDLHADMSQAAMAATAALVAGLDYDLCVLTGDYRGQAFGPYRPSLMAMREVVRALRGDVFGVLGNHDTIRMTPDLEDMGVRMLLNEHTAIVRGNASICLAGVDDAHFFRSDNLEKAMGGVGDDTFSILLSHTPEIYRQAAHAGCDLMLSGHTHGGQICLPGGVPLTLESHLPRRFGRGAWRHGRMAGYTTAGCGACILPVRFNCPPEITLHRLVRTA